MKRSLGIFALGLVVGLFFGFILARPRTAMTAAGRKASASSSETSNAISSAAPNAKIEENKIFLGNIATVPFQELYGLLSQRSPAEIAELAEQLRDLPPGRESESKIVAFFKAWAHLDPLAALQSAARGKTAEARNAAIGATIEGADASMAGSLVPAIEKLDTNVFLPGQKSGLLGAAITKWAQVDPAAAARFVDAARDTGMNFTFARYNIAQTWAAIDPAAAMAWAENDTSGPTGMSPWSGALIGWWQKDHRAAEDYAASHANAPGSDQLLFAIASQMGREDPKRAMGWINRLPNEQFKKVGGVVVASMWAINDPKGANEWAVTLPPEQMESAISATMSSWTQGDPRAAVQWAQAQRGPARDYAIGVYSATIANRDAESALTWLESIASPGIRESYMQRIAMEWLVRDSAAARAWIQSSSLSNEQKATLLRMAPGK